MARDNAYRIAEQRIEEARRLGAKDLHLVAMKLTELPESLSQLTQLRSLELSANQLAALPESLGQLTQLLSLNLRNNRLMALPESLGQLTRLRSLELSENQLAALPESLGHLTQLQSLNLRDTNLTALPEWLAKLTQLQSLDLSMNELTMLPEWLGQLTQLQSLNLFNNQLAHLPQSITGLAYLNKLDLGSNQLKEVPEEFTQLIGLTHLDLANNELTTLPETISRLVSLSVLSFSSNRFTSFPDPVFDLANLTELYLLENQIDTLPAEICKLQHLRKLVLGGTEISDTTSYASGAYGNKLSSLPSCLAELDQLSDLHLEGNPLNPELAAAYEEGLDAVKRYLRAKAGAQVVLNEAKLILIGEGEVGKSCLLGALRGDPWEEGRPTTHGIEIKPFKVTHPDNGTEITLNGWDFGGQRVYRPTHQLFFSAPAVYLVVWKPREGPQQGFVKEWIRLVKHREPDAKIIVVATHGGPKERQPDIDRQEIWDLFGKETVIDFFLVESKPDQKTQERKGIADLKKAIAHVAASLPEMGRHVPRRWEDARKALKETVATYLPLDQVLKLCRDHQMTEEEAKDFVRISHRLGHLIHYEHDPALRDIVVLKPDWLSIAMSFVLDDQQTREGHGLVSIAQLSQLWNDPERPEENRYPTKLHPVFLRLMERFDLSYRVAEEGKVQSGCTSLIAQLVPDIRPEKDLNRVCPPTLSAGDEQQVQICRIVDAKNGQSATAEGLFYQLIVRLHKYSLGRVNHKESVHWQRGLVLDDDYNGRALLENVGNDVRISVRAPYPQAFLAVLTHEVKWLVESFWAGLRCDVMVPCVEPCGAKEPGTGLYEVQRLIESKRRGRPEYPCPVCHEWQNIDCLLLNAPAARPAPLMELLAEFATVKEELAGARKQLIAFRGEAMGRFDHLDVGTQRILSKVDDAFAGLMQALTDEAKEGPRLFSFEPVDPGFLDRPKWISAKLRVTLWCEHSRLPLPALNGKDDKRGVYDLTVPREWFVKAVPFLKVLIGTLSLVVPVASSATKLMLDEATYKGIENQLDLGQKSLEAVDKGGESAGAWLGRRDAPDLKRGEEIEARGAALRQLQAWLKEKDPGFGGLVRVQNKRQEFLWVHPQFEKEY